MLKCKTLQEQKCRKVNSKFNKCFIVGLLKMETQKCRKIEIQKIRNMYKKLL